MWEGWGRMEGWHCLGYAHVKSHRRNVVISTFQQKCFCTIRSVVRSDQRCSLK